MIRPAELPPAVRPGDRVGVAALSGPVDPGRLRRGMEALQTMGFEPVPAANLASRTEDGLHAGSDAERLDAFHALTADPDVRAVVFARGGHGVLRLLSRIDWELLARHPRAYVGYSDLTPFLLQVVRRLGWVAFHGPMVAADLARGLSPEDESSFLDALAGRFPREIALVGARGEAVEAPLLGGCLSMLVSTLGTEFAPDLDGALLFWEDVNEPHYRLDRMLTQWMLSNKLKHLSGMLIGHVTGDDGARLARSVPEWVDRAFGVAASERTAEAPSPARNLGWGLPVGHRAPNRTLPLGLRALFDPERSRLTIGSS